MIIKKYSCKQFAGINNRDMEFSEGLNVILGSNEAGKSTLVEGIHSILFKPSKLDNRLSEDKNFRSKFMPIQAGDSIDGQLIISHKDKDYSISKEWGIDPYVELVMPDSTILKKEENIEKNLREILVYGEGTYSSIFFSKQRHIKEAIENIIENREATNEVGSLLRRTIMELDGVSLDKLGNKIDKEIERLIKRWDIERNYPENNRGISNPYKVGTGEIVESFYKKESIKLEMDKAIEVEKQFNEICEQIKEVQLKLKELKPKKENMENLENDITKRAILEPKINALDTEMSNLSKINQQWPRSQEKLKQLDSELIRLNEEYEILQDEKGLSTKVSEKEKLGSIIEKIENLNKKIDEIKKEISLVKKVTKDHIKELEYNYNNMKKAEAMLKAGIIIGQVNYLKDKAELMITKDFDEPVGIETGEEFSANGYIKLVYKDLFEIELKSGDIDFKELKSQYDQYKNNFESILKELEVFTIEEAKLNKEKYEDYIRDIKSFENQISLLLGDESYDSVKKKYEELGDLSKVRDLNTIDGEIDNLNNHKIELLSEKRHLESDIEKWTKEYTNIEGLFDKTVEIRMSQREIQNQLDSLAPLPEEYESTDEFRNALKQTRIEYEEEHLLLSNLKEKYFEIENSLPTSTYEELSKEYLEEQDKFNKRLEKANRLLKIKETFESTKMKMDESSFTPIIKTFSDYLKLLTNGNYRAQEIDSDFNLKLKRDDNTIMPLDLLSSGTYDSVALALRFALLENILGDIKGFLILDDCLVDLDPWRKEMAVKLIQQFAEKHQVIFTTCSPDTANLLGGNLINM